MCATRASTSPARSWWATGSTTPSATATCRSSRPCGPRCTRPASPARRAASSKPASRLDSGPHSGLPARGRRADLLQRASPAAARPAPTKEAWLDVATALDRLPKVELHCHVEGTMRPATVVELAGKNGLALPTADPTELYRYTSLDSFLEVFWLVQSALADRDDWARLAYESIVDGAAHGLVYRETFFTPARHLAAGQDLGEIVAGLAEGLEAAEKDTGARAALIAGIDRAYGGAAGRELVERLAELRRQGSPGSERVIGVGLDSTEQGVEVADFAEAFALAGRAGLEGPGLVRRLGRGRVPVTLCPNSHGRNRNAGARLGGEPFPRMREA